MNRISFQDLVRGRYGRKIAYTNQDKVDKTNVLKVLSDGIGAFNFNKPIIKYLWDYKKGDQPINYRTKTIRDDVINKIVENHAYEIVAFKVAQTYGEAIQFVSLKQDEATNKRVDKLNDYDRAANKQLKNIQCGEYQSAVGFGYLAVGFGDDIPYKIININPMNTFIIYSESTEEPMLAVQELKDTENKRYYLCYSKTHEYKIANGTVVYSKLHAFGGIPIVEYPNNQDRMSDIELVISMLDAINNFQSNRIDAVEQFVQSWIKFINCEVDKKTFGEMKMEGALVVKSNNKDNKADVDVITQELNQTESQVAKEDLWNNVLSISAIPQQNSGSDGGSTMGAVSLRSGWDFSKSRAKLKDPYVIQAEYELAKIKLNILRIKKEDLKLSVMDFEPQIPHSPQDNMQSKAQVFQMLVASGIHPLIAIKVCGLWTDSEKVYLMSKPYLDVLYKTIDEVVDNAEEQEKQAKRLVEQMNTNNNKEQA